ncbi:vicilin-like seed storage protein At2g18540 [Osmia bicornis bicornis]|uniref:vicilin-like seed storage protein At2g18540 n=1 Tax=Osmia bicornis bicornis TaxID=1437191 RepID=UPI001EAEB116|nr:vicilin-like seed storage protein At2g18540 [Osmia bicornis bicornis]
MNTGNKWKEEVLEELRKIGENLSEITELLMAGQTEWKQKKQESEERRELEKGTEKKGKKEKKEAKGKDREEAESEKEEGEETETVNNHRRLDEAKNRKGERDKETELETRKEKGEENQEGKKGGESEEERERNKEEEDDREWREEWEKRMEEERKERRKRSIVWKGVDGRDKEERSRRINIMIQLELGKKTEPRKMTEVLGEGGRRVILTELETEEDRRKIMWRKTEIWKRWRVTVEEDLSREERKIRWLIRERAKEERAKGKKVEYTSRRIWVDDQEWIWNEKERKWKVKEGNKSEEEEV